ncbi:nitroreductase [Clostridia bacterium]|nr:nitroreductase [Clostridia bacterium]
MSFQQLATDRYSVRTYKTTPVEQEKIDKILELGRIAPTARNNQPQRIKVIQTAEELAIVDEFTPCRFGAPLVLLVCYDKTVCAPAPAFGTGGTGQVDASIVTSHLLFAAEELGLGTLWVMHFDPEKASELFGLPENIVPMAVLDVGYPADDAKPAPPHSQREPLAAMLL